MSKGSTPDVPRIPVLISEEPIEVVINRINTPKRGAQT